MFIVSPLHNTVVLLLPVCSVVCTVSTVLGVRSRQPSCQAVLTDRQQSWSGESVNWRLGLAGGTNRQYRKKITIILINQQQTIYNNLRLSLDRYTQFTEIGKSSRFLLYCVWLRSCSDADIEVASNRKITYWIILRSQQQRRVLCDNLISCSTKLKWFVFQRRSFTATLLYLLECQFQLNRTQKYFKLKTSFVLFLTL